MSGFLKTLIFGPLLLVVLGNSPLGAAETVVPVGQTLVASCANCHGTNGRAVAGQAMPSLAGRSALWLQQQMAEFGSGQRPATIMQQIARGYSPQQVEQMANWLEVNGK